MASSLSNLGNNFSEGIREIKFKYGHDDKKCEICRDKYKYCDCFLEYTTFKDGLIEYECCNKNYQQNHIFDFDEKLNERFLNKYRFSNHDKNNFILLLRKGVYPYDYMDDWENFNETSLPEKEDFYSHLNMEDITGADYSSTKRVCKDFEIKNLGKYHDFLCSKQYIIVS